MSDLSLDPLQALSRCLANLAAQAAPGVVSVQSDRRQSSGFTLPGGLIITAAEVLAEEGSAVVTLHSGEQRVATIAGRDPTTDIALLRIDGAAPLGVTLAAAPPPIGSLVLSIGARFDSNLAAFGMVSLVGPEWQPVRGARMDARIELNIKLPHQGEGSLVVDADKRAVGMAVRGPRRRVLLIPTTTILRVIAALEHDGCVRRGYLGLSLRPVQVGAGGHGAMAMSLDDRGPGAASGMRQGDVITAWNGNPLPDVTTLIRALGAESIGQVVNLSLRRGVEPMEVALTIGERGIA